ncbi:Na/Pi cotransporter [Vallitalea longa]|uniref:Na/Pi cotransporter n=1 Tax=Vallitalea longa TaxID=2936439 RepID=A0A9W5YDC0_9FIRM|nr:Na/Pi cotransporter family protein [Vallitalea longa]GKX29143.1 Na/Pi cotransporter [Vallitalea longa]
MNGQTKEYIFIFFAFIGGFGMFLYGMHIMAEGLQKSAGNKMKSLLGALTNNRFLAVAVGALVTAIIQSSSACTVMIVGFVNAGLFNLSQAVGVIMGANIGTTITSWIVSSQEWLEFLKPSQFAPLAIGIGALFLFFAKSQRKKQIGEIIIGFGLLFIGLDYMKNAIEPFKDAQAFKDAFRLFGRNPVLGILTGAVVTAIIQSSSASVGILQAVAKVGFVPWSAGVYIILGQNIGTCVTAMLSSIGANKTAKRAAYIHLLFNVIGTVIFAILCVIYFKFINSNFGNNVAIDMLGISIFHTVFNISNTLILFPFANKLVALSNRIVKGSDDEVTGEEQVALRHLDDRILETPSFAVENAMKEVINMGNIAVENAKLATSAILEKDANKIGRVFEVEKNINNMEKLITEYLIKISNSVINESQNEIVTNLFHTVNDIERVGDHAENIAELAKYFIDNDLTFSESANKELVDLSNRALETIVLAIKARENDDVDLVRKVEQNEDMVDELEDELREKHIRRLAQNICDSTTGVVFLDLISNYERISDHALNIAYYVRDELL